MLIKMRLLKLGKKQVDILQELHKMGYKEVAPTTLSSAVNNLNHEPKQELIRKLCDEILTKWEKEQEEE